MVLNTDNGYLDQRQLDEIRVQMIQSRTCQMAAHFYNLQNANLQKLEIHAKKYSARVLQNGMYMI